MVKSRYNNLVQDNGAPYGGGDRYWAQDLIRDSHYYNNLIAELAARLAQDTFDHTNLLPTEGMILWHQNPPEAVSSTQTRVYPFIGVCIRPINTVPDMAWQVPLPPQQDNAYTLVWLREMRIFSHDAITSGASSPIYATPIIVNGQNRARYFMGGNYPYYIYDDCTLACGQPGQGNPAGTVMLMTRRVSDSAIRYPTYKRLQDRFAGIDEEIRRMQTIGGYLDAYNFGTASPTQSQLTNYALQEIGITDYTQIYNGTRVVNLFNDHLWLLTNTYAQDGTFQWTDQGVPYYAGDATNTTKGLIKGVAPATGADTTRQAIDVDAGVGYIHRANNTVGGYVIGSSTYNTGAASAPKLPIYNGQVALTEGAVGAVSPSAQSYYRHMLDIVVSGASYTVFIISRDDVAYTMSNFFSLLTNSIPVNGSIGTFVRADDRASGFIYKSSGSGASTYFVFQAPGVGSPSYPIANINSDRVSTI